MATLNYYLGSIYSIIFKLRSPNRETFDIDYTREEPDSDRHVAIALNTITMGASEGKEE
jgi:hypothetical protein